MSGRVFVEHVCEWSDEVRRLLEGSARLQSLVVKLTEEQIALRKRILYLESKDDEYNILDSFIIADWNTSEEDEAWKDL